MCFEKELNLNRLNNLLYSKENLKKVKKIENLLQNKKIYIYGAGCVGGDIFNLLKEYELEIEAFIDRRGKKGLEYFTRKVYRAEDILVSEEEKRNILIIVSIHCSMIEFMDIKKNMSGLGYYDVVYFGEIYNYEIIHRKSNEVIRAYSLFNDAESQKTFLSYIEAIIKSNPNLYPKKSTYSQYFPEDIIFNKGYSRFVDCGAFDGDTAINLKKYRKDIESIVLFEPDLNNFRKLYDTMSTNKIADEQILFPCGVWNETKLLSFSDNKSTQSYIGKSGTSVIQGVSLDMVLLNFRPSFIKMDVEGAEIKALIGAKNTIEKHSPDLAICVYHSVNHLWEIPLLIENINKDYCFYLRSYEEFGIETVLYATSKNKNKRGE